MTSKLNTNVSNLMLKQNQPFQQAKSAHSERNENDKLQVILDELDENDKNIKIHNIKSYLLNESTYSNSSISEENSQIYYQDFYQDTSYEEESFAQERNFTSQLNEAFDFIHYAFYQEKEKLKVQKDSIDNEKETFNKIVNEEISYYKADLIQLQDNESLILENLICKSNEVIELDIGGTTKILTSIKTLLKQPNSKLAKAAISVLGISNKNKIHNNQTLSFNNSIKGFEKFDKKYSTGDSSARSNNIKYNLNIINQTKSYNNLIIPQKSQGKYFIDRDSKYFTLVISYLRNGNIPNLIDKIEETKFYNELDFWGIYYKKPSKLNILLF